ncbi:MAG: hypothetical protein VW475_02525 [Curvibacter sp.]|nr:MAG: hypothetical protein CK604_07395 [Curvibacter sp. PD_MW3]|tara:strand:+ start:698 stop:1246 length:549 start_codon:yes stop_codon:yes gene_type:complete
MKVAKRGEPDRSLLRRKSIGASKRAHHDATIQNSHDRAREAMKVMQEEISGNRGVYPHNKGVISQAEVARRASLHPVTLHKPHYSGLVAEIKSWIRSVKVAAVVGHKRVRRDLQSRLQDHEDLHAALLESHRISETDLDRAKAELAEISERCRQLEDENRELRMKLKRPTPLKLIPPVENDR